MIGIHIKFREYKTIARFPVKVLKEYMLKPRYITEREGDYILVKEREL